MTLNDFHGQPSFWLASLLSSWQARQLWAVLPEKDYDLSTRITQEIGFQQKPA